MKSKTVNEIEKSREHRDSLRWARAELNLAMMAIAKFRETSGRYERMDYGLPDHHLDFWTLADVRAESIEEKMKVLFNQLKGDIEDD